MYYGGVEWSGAASATVVSTEYFGTAQKKNRCRALTSLPRSPLLLCLPHQIVFQSQHGMEGKANMILLCPYQYMVEYDMVWM